MSRINHQRSEKFVRRTKNAGLVSLSSFVLLILLTITSQFIIAQEKKDTGDKADKNLRGSTRINPSTLAMELSIPLGGYPGRGGNSTSFVFNYSSKVWHHKSYPAVTRERGISAPPIYTEAITAFNSQAKFGRHSIAGWTSSLQAPAITKNFDLYNQLGELHFLSPPQIDNTDSAPGDHCEIRYEPGFVASDLCSSGLMMYSAIFTCDCSPQGSCQPQGPTYQGLECWVPPSLNNNPGSGPNPNPNSTPVPQIAHVVPRIRVQMPDGSSQEFRKEDKALDCSTVPLECNGIKDGTYLSVGGTGMRLEVGDTTIDAEPHAVLYLPDGGKYVFPDIQSSATSIYLPSSYYVDRNGNKSEYNAANRTWKDTMGRDLQDPLPNPLNFEKATVGVKPFTLPGTSQPHTFTWKNLKNVACVTGSEPECLDTVLEDPNQPLYYTGSDTCQSVLNNNPVSQALFSTSAVDTITDDPIDHVRYISRDRICAANPPANPDNGSTTSTTAAVRFNPVVLAEIGLPDGTKYRFEYNHYGEITKIIYPTGGYERFHYGVVYGIGVGEEQTNRGVVEHWISFDGIAENKSSVYSSTGTLYDGSLVAEVKMTAPDESYSIRKLKEGYAQAAFGFDDPLTGHPLEEAAYTAGGQILRRSVSKYTVAAPRGTGGYITATRDPRVEKSIAIIFEPGKTQALMQMSRTEFDSNSEQKYFAHLNQKRTKTTDYVVVSKSDAETKTFSELEPLFANAPLVAVNETDYKYDANYLSRGIIGLPEENRTLDPGNLNNILARSQIGYDDENQYCALDISYTTTVGYQAPTGTYAHLRGNATTLKVWHKEMSNWLQTHTQYDQYGNARKVWEGYYEGGTPTRFTETIYDEYASPDKPYHFAYPTKVITPAPDPYNSGFGTTQTSTVETTYDPTTGLPLTVKNDFGQITKTEYDAFLRPWRVYAVNYTAPETQTIYGVPDSQTGQLSAGQRFVKTRKQIEGTNWAESTVWFDGLGRTIKTQEKDAAGDVFAETEYDKMGRVKRTTNPYRAGETKLWSKPSYDAVGRAVESFAPAPDGQTGASLGVSSFDISTVAGYTGTVNISTDPSGRKSRSITNALGQLLRVDEATATGGTVDNDLGTLAAPHQPTYYQYEPSGKMVRVQQGKTGETIQNRYFKYDSLGRLIRVRQPEQERNQSLDLSDVYNTDGYWTAGFVYDMFGNVKRATDADGVNIISEYDQAQRLKKRCYTKPNITTTATECIDLTSAQLSADTPTVYYTYDGKYYDANSNPLTATGNAKGSLTQVRNGISTSQTTKYDSFGRATEYQQITDGQTYTSKYAYNFSGALVEEEYPSTRKVRHEFNQDGDLLKVESKKAGADFYHTFASQFAYTASGGISQMKLGNGKWETAKFNDRLQVRELGLGNSATDASVWKVNYEYGEIEDNGTLSANKNTGNIARQTISFAGLTNPFVQTYRYDSLYRLKEAKEVNGTATQANWTQSFDYDRFGNRTGFSQNVGGVVNNQTPAIIAGTNRFDTTNQPYAYDRNGNIISDVFGSQARQFTLNGDNKQTEIRDPNIGASTSNPDANLIGRYLYDGEGKRVKKVTATETTIFVYSGGKLVAEYSTKLADQPSTNYTTTDHLGTPRIITDELGAVKSRRDYLPFGEDLLSGVGGRTGDTGQKYASSKDEVRQKFTGYQKDTETNLDFAEARMYQNSHGRFTAVDPLLASGKSANPQTFNRYVYVGNNPIIITDPTGLFGDFYDRQGKKLGSDTKNDGKTYFADYAGEADTEGDIFVKNVVPTNSLEVLRAQNRSRQSTPRTGGNILRDIGFPTNPYEQAWNGFVTGGKNIPPTLWNGAVDIMSASVLPGTRIFNFDGLKVGTYGCSTQINCSWSGGTTAAGLAAPGVVGGVFFGGGSSLSVTNVRSSPQFVNLASPARTNHILAGDATGGGHSWFSSWTSFKNGLLGRKSMFPMSWSEGKTMNAISEVATKPFSFRNQTGPQGSYFTNSGNPAIIQRFGTYEGVPIKVVTNGSDIITAHPWFRPFP